MFLLQLCLLAGYNNDVASIPRCHVPILAHLDVLGHEHYSRYLHGVSYALITDLFHIC